MEDELNTSNLRRLTGTTGPYVSIYFDDSHNTEDAAKRIELTWADLREQARDAGAGDAAVRALDDAMLDAPPAKGNSGRALVAAGDRVVVDERLADPPQPVVRVSQRPYLVPLFTGHKRREPVVVVVADSIGAEITVVDRHGRRHVHEAGGRDHPVHKVRGGGSAHRSIQSHAEETIEANIHDVAAETTGAVRENGARVLVLAGEVTARAGVRDALPDDVSRVAVFARGRTVPDEELRDLIDEVETAERDTVIERFQAENGRTDGLAVLGVEAVTAALREANVETLLVGDPEPRKVRIGDDPTQIDLETLSGTTAEADEAIPYAAILSGAGVVVTGDDLALEDGFAAILRHR